MAGIVQLTQKGNPQNFDRAKTREVLYFSSSRRSPRFSRGCQRCQVTGGRGWLDVPALSDEDALFYVKSIACCQDGIDSWHDMPTMLAALSVKPLSECLQLTGDASLDARVGDFDQPTSKADGSRLWNAKRLACTQSLFGSSTAGYRVQVRLRPIPVDCFICFRAHNLIIQCRCEDSLDGTHHKAHGSGQFRPRKQRASPTARVRDRRESVRSVPFRTRVKTH